MSARELFGEWTSQEIAIEVPHGFYPCNPSIVRHKGALYCTVRCVDYLLEGTEILFADGSERAHTRNFLVQLSEDLQVLSVVEIVHQPGLESAVFRGIEDLRLVSHNGELWASYTVNDRHTRHI